MRAQNSAVLGVKMLFVTIFCLVCHRYVIFYLCDYVVDYLCVVVMCNNFVIVLTYF